MVNHMRHTRGHTRNRRSHHALDSVGVTLCPDCGQPKLKHVACGSCGKYKGRDVLGKKPKVTKSASKPKAAKVAKVKPAKVAKPKAVKAKK